MDIVERMKVGSEAGRKPVGKGKGDRSQGVRCREED